MTGRSVIRVWLPVLVLVIIVAILRAGAREGVHISGDLANDLAAALTIRQPDAVFAPSPDKARLEIVAVTGWSKLAFVTGARAACGAACSPESTNRLVRVIRLAPGGSRKLVFVNLEFALSPEALEAGTFALSKQGAACLGEILAVEVKNRRGVGDRTPCLPESGQKTRWAVFGH